MGTAMPAFASPMTLTWQGRVTDVSGTPVSGTTLRVDLYIQASGGISQWDDTFTSDLADGFYSVELGSGRALDADLFGGGQVWIQASIDGIPMGDRRQLTSVPFALVAAAVAVETVTPDPFTCDAPGRMAFDTDANGLRVCDGTNWVWLYQSASVKLVNGAFETDDGDRLTSCLAYLNDAAPGATLVDGLYWIDPDGAGTGINAFKGYCDMTLDGGGWMLATWTHNGARSWSSSTSITGYGTGTDSVTPALSDFPDWLDDMPTVFNVDLNVRLTYARTQQGTLDISTDSTTRTYTSASSFRGVLQAGSPPIGDNANHTTDHNCSGYTYVNAAGTTSVLDNGCFIEFTNGDVGSWAGCGNGTDNTTAGFVWGMCFDNGSGVSNAGNSALNIWHQGQPNYHEIYEYNFQSNNPANGAWGSTGGSWTWSAWIRPE